MWSGGGVPILPKHILKPELDNGTFDSAYNISWPEENLVSSGPYMLEKFESGVKTVLRRNPGYWRVDRAGNRLPFLGGLRGGTAQRDRSHPIRCIRGTALVARHRGAVCADQALRQSRWHRNNQVARAFRRS